MDKADDAACFKARSSLPMFWAGGPKSEPLHLFRDLAKVVASSAPMSRFGLIQLISCGDSSVAQTSAKAHRLVLCAAPMAMS